jgi:hypothetical protein
MSGFVEIGFVESGFGSAGVYKHLLTGTAPCGYSWYASWLTSLVRMYCTHLGGTHLGHAAHCSGTEDVVCVTLVPFSVNCGLGDPGSQLQIAVTLQERVRSGKVIVYTGTITKATTCGRE